MLLFLATDVSVDLKVYQKGSVFDASLFIVYFNSENNIFSYFLLKLFVEIYKNGKTYKNIKNPHKTPFLRKVEIWWRIYRAFWISKYIHVYFWYKISVDISIKFEIPEKGSLQKKKEKKKLSQESWMDFKLLKIYFNLFTDIQQDSSRNIKIRILKIFKNSFWANISFQG